ncbi:hypothetical protein [Denitromonas sp.]|uniref:hypothetical protein n=1 Tax=Denitromonas sp. TaxID=2734609 RepID=UPI003A88FED6
MDREKEVARLKRKVSKWLTEWVEKPYSKTSTDESREDLEAYADGRDDYLSRVDIRTLHFWHLVHFEHAVLNEGQDGQEDLALAVRYAEACVRFEEAFADAGQNGSLLLPEAAFYFSLAVLAGDNDAAGRIGKALHNGLDTRLLDLQHTDRHEKGELYRHFWFLMHLYEQGNGERFDIKNYSYPPDMSPYAEVITDWKTPDLAKVHDWVCEMADFHLQQTRNTAHEVIEEFDVEFAMLFPYEILCWLRLREWAGLENPEQFDHPLMQQPLARLPTPVPRPVPDTPLLDQVIAKFRQAFPDSFR